MTRLLTLLATLALALTLTACKAEQPTSRFDKIAKYVKTNTELLAPEGGVEFFEFSEDGLYFGYYYTENNDVLLPDFYTGDHREAMQAALHEADGGFCFGDPNSDTDWCFVKKITDRWFYYELHQK